MAGPEGLRMPYATTPDDVQLYFEEAGEGTPILFIHEFAADYASWEPQMRYFSRSYRCISYSARGYIPSHIPPADAYSYRHFRILRHAPCTDRESPAGGPARSPNRPRRAGY